MQLVKIKQQNKPPACIPVCLTAAHACSTLQKPVMPPFMFLLITTTVQTLILQFVHQTYL